MSVSEGVNPGPAALLEIDGAIARITLNRPRNLNVLTPDLATSLLACMAKAIADRSVRVVLLNGAGRAFMAGGDLIYLRDSSPNDAHTLSGALIGQLNEIVTALRTMTIPTVAVAHGAVAGAGLSLLLACDYAIAAENTRFVYAYSGIAASPDGGLSRTLVDAVGYKRAMQFAFLEPQLSAGQALELGLVNQVAPAQDIQRSANALADRLARIPLRAFAETKRLFLEAPHTLLPVQLQKEREAFQRCSRTADLHEGVRAFFEQRAAHFDGERL
jgi:2-(1,2-epoxy-1,2-dihydrophenyl)acetyl-CoA isomerase